MKFLLIVFFFFTACNKSPAERGLNPKSFSFQRIGKMRGPMLLNIQSSLPDSSRLLLSASVKPFEDFGLARVEWKVPEHIKIHEGLVQQELELKAGQTYQVQLTLDTEGLKEGDQIFLFVYKMRNAERHGVSTSYTYRPETGGTSE